MFDQPEVLEEREGSNKDRQLMEAVFTKLQFEVRLYSIYVQYNYTKALVKSQVKNKIVGS